MRPKIPTILAIGVLLVGVVAGIFLIGSQQTLRIGASPDTAPQDVRITNITDSGFTVSWITDKPTIGYVEYGTSESLGQNTTAGTTASNVHYSQVTGLNPSTNYVFKINSANFKYDNNGTSWTAKTATKITASSSSLSISGTILGAGGVGVANILVYVTASGGSPLSALTSTNGSWVIPLGNARTLDLANYLNPSSETTVLQIFVQGGIYGVATAQSLPKNSNPTPAITLGQTYDFRNETGTNNQTTSPTSTLSLPETSTASATSSSGFNIATTSSTATASSKPVTLISVNQGEVVNTTKPEFFGGGPPNTKITITVQSDPVTGNVTTDSKGNWEWSPPTNLAPGTHTITISWKDVSGILKTLTRSFTVLASDGPAFVSTPSATATPTATPVSTSSGTSRVVLPSTESAVPISGIETPTVIFAITGISLLGIGFVIWKKSY